MAALVGTIQIRKDTAANFTLNNPTLLSGEPALETDTRKRKIGDGVTAWNSLAYNGINDGDTLVTGLTFPNTGFAIEDTGADHVLKISPSENLTANRTLNLAIGDANRSVSFPADGTHSGTNTGDSASDPAGSAAAAQAAAIAAAAADATTKANAAQAASQPIDADLTAIAGLTPSNDDIIQRKSGAWTNRTISQFAADLFTTVGNAIRSLTNPSAVTWLRVNADNSVTARTASETLTDIGAIGNSLIDAKGDLIVGASDNTPARLAVGGNGTVLMANSSATDGVEWVTRPVSLPVIFGLNGVTIAVTTTETVFNSTTVHQIQRDLTNYRQVRLVVNRQGTAGPTGAKAILKYRAGAQSTTVANFSDIGTSEVSCDIVTANTQAVSSWIDLAASAKADVMITVTLVCSSGTASPVIGAIEMQCR